MGPVLGSSQQVPGTPTPPAGVTFLPFVVGWAREFWKQASWVRILALLWGFRQPFSLPVPSSSSSVKW